MQKREYIKPCMELHEVYVAGMLIEQSPGASGSDMESPDPNPNTPVFGSKSRRNMFDSYDDFDFDDEY